MIHDTIVGVARVTTFVDYGLMFSWDVFYWKKKIVGLNAKCHKYDFTSKLEVAGPTPKEKFLIVARRQNDKV